MVRKNWIVTGCCVAVVAMLCAVAYAEKGEKKCSLPAAVEAAVKALFPNAVIEKSEKEEEKVEMYEVNVKDAGKESDVTLAADGTVVEIETVIDINALPAAAAQTIKAQDGKVSKIEKIVEQAQLKLVKLDTPITAYEAKITKDGKEIEIKVAADGTILKQEAKKKDKDDDDDKD
jgi:hypothetical protein